MSTELHHKVSKEASNSFFEIAKKRFHQLMIAKNLEGISKSTPQFVHLRRSLYNDNVPKIYLEVAYRNRVTGEETVLQDLESIPTTQYPRSEYNKLYEIASVKVITLFTNNFNVFSHFFRFSQEKSAANVNSVGWESLHKNIPTIKTKHRIFNRDHI